VKSIAVKDTFCKDEQTEQELSSIKGCAKRSICKKYELRFSHPNVKQE